MSAAVIMVSNWAISTPASPTFPELMSTPAFLGSAGATLQTRFRHGREIFSKMTIPPRRSKCPFMYFSRTIIWWSDRG